MSDPRTAEMVATTLPRLLTRWAGLTPGRTAFREKIRGVWRKTDWAGYLERVRLFAKGLEEDGFRRGDLLAIASEDTSEWIVADLAAQSLGGVVVGIYPTNPWPEVQYILRHSRCRFVLCGDQEQVDKVLDAAREGDGLPHLARIICADMRGVHAYDDPRIRSFEAVSSPAQPPSEAWWADRIAQGSPDDVCIVVYTSGTTGAPKGAQITHRNLLFSADAIAGIYGLDARNYSVLCYLPLCHIAERVMSVVLHLRTGGVVNFAESIDTVVTNIREIGPTVFLGVPRIWEKNRLNILIRLKEAYRPLRWLFETSYRRVYGKLQRRPTGSNGAPQPGSPLSRLEDWLYRVAIFRPLTRHLGIDHTIVRLCGAASVSPETLRFFEVLGRPVYQAYGSTEFGIAFIQHEGARTNGCCGNVIPGLEYRIEPDGEILVRGPTVFAGYLDDERGTANVLDADGWLHSGDVVEEINGEIRVVDRKKAIIITSGGKNIAPSEIEDALKESIYVKEAILLGEARHFVSALIQIDMESVGKWAQERGLAYTNYSSLSRLPAIRELVATEVDRVNGRFARVENIRKFVILSKELDHDDGELTATQKVRRSHIEKSFAAEIAEIYGESAT